MTTDDLWKQSKMWTRSEPLPDEHRLFYTDDARRVAIADLSGDAPQFTDDGILWLDFTRPLALGAQTFIPLRAEDGTETRTPTDAPTIVLLAETFGWGINVRGILYDVKRRTEGT